ncbi:sugar ABC transporter permease [Vibrio sp. S9_S30]|uniref:carbohydrate ABC transporter permease n=1 Tax=Vibrio sp. S9_S30 TaxID=2720226 RepID=UPI0016816761|nr:sugar ABC transporter permease [Vibrio sp. S9_S30]MBD1557514.1 sugar ABC transporter permease [Vibrio sp. S9_S30]
MSNEVWDEKRHRAQKRKDALTPYLFISPWIIGFLAFTAGPIALSFVMSFYDWPVVGERTFVGLDNYITMTTEDPDFWASLWVTVKFAALFVPYNVLISLLLALLLNQKVVGAGVFRTIFYIPSVISGVALVTIWGWVYNDEYGILNYMLSFAGIDGPNWLGSPDWALWSIVIASLWGLGTTMLIFLTGLKNIPQDLYESATISGVPTYYQFFAITVPMLSPVILFVLVTSVITAFQQLTIALLLTKGGPLQSTYFFAMYIYDNAFEYFEMGYASAASWVMFLIILTLSGLIIKSSGAWVYYESEIKSKKTQP